MLVAGGSGANRIRCRESRPRSLPRPADPGGVLSVEPARLRPFADFQHATPAELAALAGGAQVRRLAAGEDLYAQGVVADGSVYLESGYVQAEYVGCSGWRYTTGYGGPDEGNIGLRDALAGTRRITRAWASEPSDVIVVGIDPLAAFLRGNALALAEQVRFLVHQRTDALHRVAGLSGADLPRRLCRLLMSYDRNGFVDLPMTRAEAAACVGVSRQELSSAIAHLCRRGYLEPTSRSGLRVLDRAALLGLAQQSELQEGPADVPPSADRSVRTPGRTGPGGAVSERTLASLLAVPMLADLDRAALSTVRTVELPAGATGAPESEGEAWVLLRGAASHRARVGNAALRVGDVLGDDVVGAARVLVPDLPPAATVLTADEDALFAALPRRALVALRSGESGYRVAAQAARDLTDAVVLLAEIGGLPARERVVQAVQRHHARGGHGALRIRQAALAGELGVSRQTVSTTIAGLCRTGVLVPTRPRGSFLVPDTAALEHAAAAA